MGAAYSKVMPPHQTLPDRWLLSDARNDAALERALSRLPRGSGFIYRHYHLPDEQRFARFRVLARLARARGHCVILADSALTAKEWRADGYYGAPRALLPRRSGLLTLATVHNLREIALANRLGAAAVLLSPAFATRSHPGASTLGPMRFHRLAARSNVPVIALGGMDQQAARRLRHPRWAAIDGLSGRRRIGATEAAILDGESAGGDDAHREHREYTWQAAR
ncbi:thiamine phosphate synthase [Altererythrobacter sp. B11]|uniref:thiamine phosphate synthase n=1 Tax=Altererythrobacter sp. B11 TaxID=2060312 RepID=UPI000DC6F444|nr:thiamine phosphate synthase [Altererythrobacter sp. B11]BBC71165.1 thiamine phosphate synthase [Altererythrobacter sp. B11]